MPYKSLFQPISEQELSDFHSSHDIKLNTINEDGIALQPAPQAVTPMPAQPDVAPQQPAAQPVQAQPAQAQTAAPIDAASLSQLGKSIQSACPAAAQDQGLLTMWKTLQAQPTVQNLMVYMSAFAKFAGQQTAQQPVAQGQTQPGAAPQQPAAQPAQAQPLNNSLQPKSSWSLIKRKVRYNKALKEAEEAKAATDGSDNTKSTAPKSSSKKADDFSDDKSVDYASEYDEKVSGKKGETTVENKDKIMYDSIFGSKEDPFADSKEVTYNKAYDERGEGPSERPDNTSYTKPEPFNPEKPKLTTLSDASAVSKTVFTIDDNGTVKDTGASGDTKHIQDDGSDEDVNEGFSTKVPKHLSESVIDDDLKKTIIRQFINASGDSFDISDFAGWLEDEYPAIAADQSAFDEISQSVQDSNGVVENDDVDDDIEREEEGHDDDFRSDDDFKDKAEEYIADTDLDEYDEDDAIAWCEENYPEIASDDDSLDDFLDAVCDMFTEDDINESFNDEFYASEHELKS
jgi:hypothetical protein